LILLTGAAGKTGTSILKQLSQRGAKVKALVRNQDQASVVGVFKGIEIAIGDLLDEQSLAKAAHIIDEIYYICPNMSPDELLIGTRLIGLAQKHHIKRFVFHSVLHPHIEEMPHHWQKMRMEEKLFSSGLDFTILQPCAYMQNILSGWNHILEGQYTVPYNINARISIVDLEDIGQVAANVLMESGHKNAIYELAGPEALSQIDVAGKISAVLNKQVNPVQQSQLEWKNNALKSNLPAAQIDWLLKMFNYYDNNGLPGNSNVLEYLLGKNPTTFDQFLLRTLSSGGIE